MKLDNVVDSKYDFPVKLQPIQTEGLDIPDKLAVVRTDTKRSLGIVSPKYGLLYHKEVVNSFRTELKDKEFEEKIVMQNNGARMFLTYTFPKVKYEVKKGDMVSLRFIATNSYDGSKLLNVSMGALRLVCENGMVIGKEFFSLSQRHIGDRSIGEKFSVPLTETIGQMADMFKNSIPTMQTMQQTPLKEREDLFDKKRYKHIPTYLLDNAQTAYLADKEKTVWSYYNALTQAITHNQRKENLDAKIYFLRDAWNAANRSLK